MTTTIKVLCKIRETEKYILIDTAHIGRTGEHFSLNITYNILRIKYEWQNQYKELKEYIDSCECNALTRNDTKQQIVDYSNNSNFT